MPGPIEDIKAMTGGCMLFESEYRDDPVFTTALARRLTDLDQHSFWERGIRQNRYRAAGTLWAPQRKAVAFSLAYLTLQQLYGPKSRDLREAALIKMPTGSGKTGVIAALACCAPELKRVIVLTPRSALVSQLIRDLSWKFWSRLGLYYEEGELKPLRDAADLDDKRKKQLERSVYRLLSDDYFRIWTDRAKGRQIIVGTFNALHAVLAPRPPAHRSMMESARRKPSAVLGKCVDDERFDKDKGVENFQALLRAADLLIVDEGHYEPAFSWSQCIDEINAPTLLLSATPYRNDYKYFNIRGNFTFNLGFDEAAEKRLIRQVELKTPPTASGILRKPAKKDGEKLTSEYIDFIIDRVRSLPKNYPTHDAKIIVHASRFSALRWIQTKLWERDPSIRPILIHDVMKAAKSAQDGDATEDGENGARAPRDGAPTVRSNPNGDLKQKSATARKALQPVRFEHVDEALAYEQARVQAGEAPTRVWLHQFKLLEGVDDSNFREIHLFDGFLNARQLVQQVGRALRYSDPKRTRTESATVFAAHRLPNRSEETGSEETIYEAAKRQWDGYRDYEAYADKDPGRAFSAETQLLPIMKANAPSVQYLTGMFRRNFFGVDKATMAEFALPRRAMVCRYSAKRHRAYDPSIPDDAPDGELTSLGLDRIARDCMTAMQLEERFEIRRVEAPADDPRYRRVRLIRYLKWANSKLLPNLSLPEWKLGVMAIVWTPPFAFLLDTEGLCVDYSKLGFYSPGPKGMKRLFSETAPNGKGDQPDRVRIVEASATGLDLSDIAIRSMSVRKRNLSRSYFDLAEASQTPASVHGVALLGEDTVRRQLSIRRSRVSDPTQRNIRVHEFCDWTRQISEALERDDAKVNPLFDRFAVEADEPPARRQGSAQSLFLDLWSLLNPDEQTFEQRDWNPEFRDALLEAFESCLEMQDVEIGPNGPSGISEGFLEDGNGQAFRVQAEYIRRDTVPPSGRYRLTIDEIDDELILTDRRGLDDSETHPLTPLKKPGQSLVALINAEQAFRIIPKQNDVVYANGVFYKPSINWEAVRDKKPGNLLEVIEASPFLRDINSEKGDDPATTAKNWRTASQFGRIVDAFTNQTVYAGAPAFGEIAECDTLVCNDGSREICDFICLDQKKKKVILLHAKAGRHKPGVSVSNLQVVGRQASASLAFIGATSSRFERPSNWLGAVSVQDGVDPFLRVKTKPVGDAPVIEKTDDQTDRTNAYEVIVEALRNPAFRREVWIVTANLIDLPSLREQLTRDFKPQTALQFAYYLADIRSAFGRANVALRIFCEALPDMTAREDKVRDGISDGGEAVALRYSDEPAGQAGE